MRLIDALNLSRQASEGNGTPFRVFLACGFTPLHLATYLTACVSVRAPGRRICWESGLFGDLPGTLDQLEGRELPALAVFIEWSDLDPRLSARQAPPPGGVTPDAIVQTVVESLERIRPRLLKLALRGYPVSLSLPTIAPLGWGHQPDAFETSQQLAVDSALNEFARAAAQGGVQILSRSALDQRSPHSTRHDLKSELQSGFPYTLVHTEALAELTARLLCPDPPKKAIITDLDNTLWSGIAGEIGPDQVGWTLDQKGSLHAHYQQILTSLAAAGVLIGAASKNDPAVAEAALSRSDLVIPRSSIFPLEAHWRAKSESVARILRAWNIGAEGVVFVDDSPMELAEVQQAFPAITCLQFPHGDAPATTALFQTLRNLCGRARVGEEDLLRAKSLEQGAQFAQEQGSSDQESFLASLQGRITFQDGTGDPRALELVNKTNQFNLHGQRYAEDEWRGLLAREGAFVWTVSYEDRFGPLGKIAVLAGECRGKRILVRDMVLSCRAFSRRVEHAALRFLLESSGATEIEFQYRPTNRNGPLRDFLKEFTDLPAGESRLVIERPHVEAILPRLHHQVLSKTHA